MNVLFNAFIFPEYLHTFSVSVLNEVMVRRWVDRKPEKLLTLLTVHQQHHKFSTWDDWKLLLFVFVVSGK